MFPMDLRTTAAKQRRAEMDHRTFFPLLPGHAGKNMWHRHIMEAFSRNELHLSFESSVLSELSTTYSFDIFCMLKSSVQNSTVRLCNVCGEELFK